jgi:hypothetical protein
LAFICKHWEGPYCPIRIAGSLLRKGVQYIIVKS